MKYVSALGQQQQCILCMLFISFYVAIGTYDISHSLTLLRIRLLVVHFPVALNVRMCHVERMWEYSDSYKSVAFQKCEHFRRQNVICQFEISWKLTDQSMNGFFRTKRRKRNSLGWAWIFKTKRMWFSTVRDRARGRESGKHENQCKCKCHRQQNERLNLQIVCYRNDRHYEFTFLWVCLSLFLLICSTWINE